MPTPREIVDRMLEVANVRAGDVVQTHGCGDGRMVIAAAKKYGTRGAKRAGVEALVTFEVEDMFATDLRAATVVLG